MPSNRKSKSVPLKKADFEQEIQTTPARAGKVPQVKESNASSSEGLQDVDNDRSEVDLEEIKADLERQQIISN